MKLIEALELADDCGLESISEAIFNVYLHASQLFVYDKIEEEYNEIFDEWHNLRDHTVFDSTSSVREVMDYLRKEK